MANSSTIEITKSTTEEILPLRLWGLDPLFRCAIKLFIKQIHQLQLQPDFEGVYKLYGHIVTRFQVVGCIISIHRKEQFIKFAVDDGTSVIQCCVWLNNLTLNIAQELFSIKLGDLVTVNGKLNIFREEKEITVDVITIESDPNYEAYHWLEVIKLQEVYKKDFVLPKDFSE